MTSRELLVRSIAENIREELELKYVVTRVLELYSFTPEECDLFLKSTREDYQESMTAEELINGLNRFMEEELPDLVTDYIIRSRVGTLNRSDVD